MSEAALAPELELVDCAMCGHRFDPRAASACSSCPLGKGCSLACCPSCGYSVPDPGRSALLRLARRLAAARVRPRVPTAVAVLADAAPGTHVEIDTLDDVPDRYRDQLLAYGLAPGRLVEVLQSDPATVVRIEHAELALERSLSRTIRVAAAPEDRA